MVFLILYLDSFDSLLLNLSYSFYSMFRRLW